MSISSANLAILSSKKELNQHRKLFPCQFERIIEQEGIYRRYYSMTQTILYGEFILNEFQEQDGLSRFVYLEPLEDELWYGAAFLEGELLYEYVEPFDVLINILAYDCHKAQYVFCPTELEFLYAEKLIVIEPFNVNEETLNDYQLNLVENSRLLKIIRVFFALVLSAMVTWYLFVPSAETPIEKVTITSPTTEFINTYSTRLSASNALTNAIHLLMETALLPAPAISDKVTLEGGALVAAVNKNKVNTKTWNAWLDTQSLLLPWYSDEMSRFSFPVAHSKWKPFVLDTFLVSFLDALKPLDIDVSNQQSTVTGNITSHSMVLSFTGALSHLLVLNELISSQAITTNSLSLTRNSPNEFSLTLSLSLHGVTHEY
ncbi:hypothetical protein GNP84_06650 [Aliivibrio fischeri]|uniref:hypothetical protein n=1 Tax=Aliivibrio fischeri TaxID=668 RepID=UPI0012D9F31E|nr:hypothetical protein [Aliivibrio fischeri]MUK76585.1 hypothetical protein [Aliivibrio fischeri]